MEVHKGNNHSKSVQCNLCDLECRTDSELLLHEEQVHKKSKFMCSECNSAYPSARKLEEHKQHKHCVISWYPCDHCGFKCANITDLDVHIASHHKSNETKRRKDIDMRDVQNKRPCNPADPMHSKS